MYIYILEDASPCVIATGGGIIETKAAPVIIRELFGRLPKRAIREFSDVVFEDVVFDHNSSVTPY